MFKKHSSPKQCEECSLERERPVRILLQKPRVLTGKGDSMLQSSGRKTNFLQGFNADKFVKRLFIYRNVGIVMGTKKGDGSLALKQGVCQEKNQKENELFSVLSSLSC